MAGVAKHTNDEEIEKIRDQGHTEDPYLPVAGFGLDLSHVRKCEQSQSQGDGQDLRNTYFCLYIYLCIVLPSMWYRRQTLHEISTDTPENTWEIALPAAKNLISKAFGHIAPLPAVS